MDKHILKQLSDRFSEIAKEQGFDKLVVHSFNYWLSEVYAVKTHALQIEIDWREKNLYMYAVYLKNTKLPDKNVIYKYSDGHWCRKYLEEIYATKRPRKIADNKTFSLDHMFDVLEFYAQLIKNNPQVVKEFFENIENI